MSSILGGGSEVINQASPGNSFQELIQKLSEAAQSFNQSSSGSSLDDFVKSLVSPDIEPNPTPLAAQSSLGAVQDRLLTPIAGNVPLNLGPIEDRLIGSQLNNLFQTFDPTQQQSPLAGLLGRSSNVSNINQPNIFRNIGR